MRNLRAAERIQGSMRGLLIAFACLLGAFAAPGLALAAPGDTAATQCCVSASACEGQRAAECAAPELCQPSAVLHEARTPTPEPAPLAAGAAQRALAPFHRAGRCAAVPLSRGDPPLYLRFQSFLL